MYIYKFSFGSIYLSFFIEGNLNYIMIKYKRRKVIGFGNKMGNFYL